MNQFFEAAACDFVILISRVGFKIDHFVTISFYRPGDGGRVAVVDAQLHYQAVGRVIIAVGSHVEIKQVRVTIFDRPGDARRAVIAAAACDQKRRAFLDGRE